MLIQDSAKGRLISTCQITEPRKSSYYVKVLRNLEDFNSCFNNLCLHVGRVVSGHQLGKPSDVPQILLTYEGNFVFIIHPT